MDDQRQQRYRPGGSAVVIGRYEDRERGDQDFPAKASAAAKGERRALFAQKPLLTRDTSTSTPRPVLAKEAQKQAIFAIMTRKGVEPETYHVMRLSREPLVFSAGGLC